MAIFKNIAGKLKKLSREDRIASLDYEAELYAIPIYNSRYNLVSLIKFSDRYIFDAYQLVSACTNIRKLTVKTIDKTNTASDIRGSVEDAERKDISRKSVEAFEPEDVPEQIHYIVLAGSGDDYAYIFDYIENASNPILEILMENVIYKCRPSKEFDKHINYGIINESSFDHIKVLPKYDEELEYRDFKYITDTKSFVHMLPNMSKQDLLDITHCFTPEHACGMQSLHDALLDPAFIIYAEDICQHSIPGMENADYKMVEHILESPVYMIEDDDYLIGNASDEYIDDIFKQQYNKFTGLVDEVEEYKSIDEVIGTVETEGESKDDDTVRKYS